ncbi:TIGR02611 family protein [Micromonospora sp. HM5-17]|uniref:TIGR02611 family protein n=1 Tax=Micromonospora sp. HM5-17 TaxID=2487710 RepID=UPI0035136DF5
METAPATGARTAAGLRTDTAGTGKERRYDVPEGERVPRGDRSADSREECAMGESVTGGESVMTATSPDPPLRWRRIRTALQIVRANPTGRFTLRVMVALAGAVVVLLGLALIPLPGPGWLIVIGGLGIWAVEFHWAKRLLGFTRRHVQAWARWVRGQSLLVRMVIGSVGLVFVAVVVWFSLRVSLGIDVVARIMTYLATH